MQIEKIKDSELNAHYKVTIPSSKIDAEVDGLLVHYGQTVSLKGFRKGKVPLAVLRQQYGRRVLGEVLEKVVNETSREVMEQNNVRPAGQPKIEVESFDKGQDLVYSIEVDKLPVIELKDVSKLVVERPVANVREEEVQKTLESVAKHNKNHVELKKERATKEGDLVNIDFAGRLVDGTTFPGMESKGFDLELGSGQFIPGFEDQLIGKKIGDDVEVKVTFPAEYQMADLAGQETIFDVKIHSIKETQEMGIDDDLAKKVGFESLANLKESIRNKLQSEYDKMSQIKLKRNVLDLLDKEYDFAVPQNLVDIEYGQIEAQVKHERHHEHDHDHGPDCDHDHELSADEQEELRGIALRRVKLGLVLAEVGRENNIDVSQEELQNAVMQEARKYPGHEQQVVELYSKNMEALASVRAPIFEEKVVNHIADLVDVKEVVVTPEELAREEDDEDEADAKPAKAKKAPAKKAAAKKSDDKEAEPKKAAAKKPAAKKSAAKK